MWIREAKDKNSKAEKHLSVNMRDVIESKILRKSFWNWLFWNDSRNHSGPEQHEFTLNLGHNRLILISLATEYGESEAFEHRGAEFILLVFVGEQARALWDGNSAWRTKKFSTPSDCKWRRLFYPSDLWMSSCRESSDCPRRSTSAGAKFCPFGRS